MKQTASVLKTLESEFLIQVKQLKTTIKKGKARYGGNTGAHGGKSEEGINGKNALKTFSKISDLFQKRKSHNFSAETTTT